MAKTSKKTLKLKEIKENKKVKNLDTSAKGSVEKRKPVVVKDSGKSITERFAADLNKLKKSEIIERAVVMLDTIAIKEISIDNLTNVNNQQADQIGSLKDASEKAKLKINELKANVDAAVNTGNEYLADKGLLQRQVKDLKATLASKENTIEQITADRDDRRSRVKHLESVNKNAKAKIKKYEEESLWEFITRKYL